MSNQKQIDSLTPEQEAQIPKYLAEYKAIGLSTAPTDKAAAEAAVIASYHYQKLATPEFIWAADPFEGAKLAAQHAKGDTDVTNSEIQDQATKASYGSFNAQWVVFYAFIARELKVKHDNLIDIVDELIKQCGVYWTFTDLVIMTPKPTAIHMKEDKLHNPSGLALEYASGKGVYALEGERKASLMEAMMQAKYGNKAGNSDEAAS